MLIFLAVVAVLMLILVGVGMVLGVMVIGIVAALLFFGVLSTSILVGLKDKRLESSARAFVVQLAAILGAFGGGVGFCLAALVFPAHQSMRMVVGLGIVCGIACGIIVGWLLDKIWCHVRTWITARKTPAT